MIELPPDLTVLDLLRALPGSLVRHTLMWQIDQPHSDRFGLLELIVDECYRNLTEARRHYSEMTEDQLTQIIVHQLKSAGLDAEHDVEIGGHCDVRVRARDGFLWIGEAKIYNGPAYLMEGFLQLSTRYGLAQAGRDRGEMIIYHKQLDARSALGKWREHLVAGGHAELSEDLSATGVLHFRTIHSCLASGCPFGVRHTFVPLFFDPRK